MSLIQCYHSAAKTEYKYKDRNVCILFFNPKAAAIDAQINHIWVRAGGL